MKQHSKAIVSILLGWVIIIGCHGATPSTTPTPVIIPSKPLDTIPIKPRVTFKQVKAKYDTLIPLFDGLFITHWKVDTIAVPIKDLLNPNRKLVFPLGLTSANARKWGVIDSAGNIVVPFICDGIRALDAYQGIASIYRESRSMNTGIPRYKYWAKSFYFTKDGKVKRSEKDFEIVVEHLSDFHNEAFVITQGPAFYLPAQYRKVPYPAKRS